MTGSISSLVGKFRRSPLGFIPIAAQNPLSLGRRLRAFADAAGKFRGAGRVVQLHIVELRPPVDKVHVRVVETGKQEFAGGIDDAGLRAAPGIDIGIGADGDNAVAQDRDGLGRRDEPCRRSRLWRW